MDNRKEIGQVGEDQATYYLQEKGYQIIERNWRSRLGELDIIALEQNELIIVEVRTTTQTRFGFGYQSVDIRKQQKVRRLAVQYAQHKKLTHLNIRCDVISVLWDQKQNQFQLDHIHGAF